MQIELNIGNEGLLELVEVIVLLQVVNSSIYLTTIITMVVSTSRRRRWQVLRPVRSSWMEGLATSRDYVSVGVKVTLAASFRTATGVVTLLFNER